MFVMFVYYVVLFVVIWFAWKELSRLLSIVGLWEKGEGAKAKIIIYFSNVHDKIALMRALRIYCDWLKRDWLPGKGLNVLEFVGSFSVFRSFSTVESVWTRINTRGVTILGRKANSFWFLTSVSFFFLHSSPDVVGWITSRNKFLLIIYITLTTTIMKNYLSSKTALIFSAVLLSVVASAAYKSEIKVQ